MKNKDIIVIDSVKELWDDKQQAVVGRIITDKAGNETKIKKGKGGKLEDRWGWLDDEGAGKAIKLQVELFKDKYPFVADFKVVKDEFVKQATERVQAQAKDSREDSIEAQVAFKGMVELFIAGALNKDETNATIRWAMGRIDLPAVIVTKIEEAKGETTKTSKSSKATNQSQDEEQVSGQDGREGADEECPVTNVGSLFNWIMAMDSDIKSPRVWVQTEFGLSDKEVITNEKAVALYKTIKKDKGW